MSIYLGSLPGNQIKLSRSEYITIIYEFACRPKNSGPTRLLVPQYFTELQANEFEKMVQKRYNENETTLVRRSLKLYFFLHM